MAFRDRIQSAMEGRGPMTRSQVRTRVGAQKGAFDQRFVALIDEGCIVQAGTSPRGVALWEWGDAAAIDRFLARPPVRRVA